MRSLLHRLRAFVARAVCRVAGHREYVPLTVGGRQWRETNEHVKFCDRCDRNLGR